MDKAKAIKDSFKHEAQKLLSELQAFGDEVRVKAHLAGAEGRDAWNKLQPQLEQFEQRVQRATEAAMGELRLASKELKSNLERLQRDSNKH
jgi:hypothetical protein